MKKLIITLALSAVFMLGMVLPAYAVTWNTTIMPQIGNGSANGAVRGAQWVLTDVNTYYKYGCSPGTVDGIFGPNTLAGTKAYQKAKGLTADGIIGINTWGKMGAQLAQYDVGPTNRSYSIIGGTDRWLQRISGGAWYVQTMSTGTQYKMSK